MCGAAQRHTSGPGWHFTGSAEQLSARFGAILEALKSSEWAQVQVLPVRDGQPVYWQAMTLPKWLTRAQTTWFPEALSHLKVAFQPVFDLRSGAVFGFEALIRAQVGQQLYGAGELLGAAPAHGGLHLFDRQARQAAIRQGAALTQSGHLLINFMPGVVYDPEVCLNTTFAVCRESGIDPARLIFEVVETEHFPDLDLLRSVLGRYRREGMQVALDDLGAGQSSLVYLEALRPDIVKLDKSLMIGITSDDPRTALVGALIRYAHELGVQVVAEGLETAAELAAATALGADLGQGYGLSRPTFERNLVTEAAACQQIQAQGKPSKHSTGLGTAALSITPPT
ncbi:EAL domain-containing protein [Deinococcus psychrotolerans]|nr:EAL domain-containing protein [Deinococcus psychrotolerans]